MRKMQAIRKGRRGIASAAVAMSLAATVVGVGTAAVSSSASAATKAAAASGPIVVGGVDAGFNFPGTAVGFQAGIYRFNKAGGLGGRKIKFVGVQDDQDSPASETTDVQQLIQSDHVFAVTPFADDVASSQLTTFLGQNKTPVIGYGVEQAFCENKWAISIIGCQQSFQGWETTSSIRQIIQASKKPGSQLKVAMEGYDSAPAVTVSQTLGEVWTSLGAKVVINQNNIPITGAQSQAPFVQAILATDPNIVFEVTGSAAGIALAAALHAAGYTGIIYNGATYEPSAVASQPSVASALKGVYTTNLLPTEYDGTPAVKQELKDLKSVGAAPDIEIGTDIGYWSAQLFIQLLQATKARGAAVTPANVAATVAKGITVKPTLSGGNGPLTWPTLSDQPQPCTSTVEGAGTTYKLFQKFTCYPNRKVATSAG
jgi:branched-chain amino acid transport system substrate-binding protein